MFLVLMALAGAQEVQRPAAVEVLALDGTAVCPELAGTSVPRLLRTTIGPMTHNGDGTYALGCPTLFGGDPLVSMASSPDGAQVLAAGPEGAWYSDDAGCSTVRLELTAGDVPRVVSWFRQAFWVVADHGEGDGASLYRFDGASVVRVADWADFRPDGMVGEDGTYLWLAGALPTPGVRRLSFAGGLTGDVPLPNLPLDTDLQALIPVAAITGEAWLRAERRTSQGTWNALVVGAGVLFSDTGERPSRVLGPVWLGQRWMAVQDGAVALAPYGEGQWQATGKAAPWTCLQGFGDEIFACTVPALLRVRSVSEEGEPATEEVFSMAQVGPPTCLGATCAADLAQYGPVIELDPEVIPAVCPDGRTLDDITGSAGCGCEHGVGGGGLWVFGLAALRGRRLRVLSGRVN